MLPNGAAAPAVRGRFCSGESLRAVACCGVACLLADACCALAACSCMPGHLLPGACADTTASLSHSFCIMEWSPVKTITPCMHGVKHVRATHLLRCTKHTSGWRCKAAEF